MGGFADLITGIYGDINDPTQKERNQLGSLGAFDTATGEALTSAGSQFDLDILSGDPSKIASALAPEISGQQGQIEQNKLQGANFGTRSGGTAASNENADAAGRANIINLVGGLQGGTAGSALSAGSGLLGQATANIGTEADLAHQQFKDQLGSIDKTVTGAGQIAGSIANAFTQDPQPQPAGGADPLGVNTGGPGPSFGMDPLGQNPGPDLSAFQPSDPGLDLAAFS